MWMEMWCEKSAYHFRINFVVEAALFEYTQAFFIHSGLSVSQYFKHKMLKCQVKVC